MKEAIQKKGFSFIEIISPCPTLYGRRNRLGDGLEMMQFYKENSLIKNGADTRDVGLDFKGKIICGKFVDRERPSFLEQYNAKMAAEIRAFLQTLRGGGMSAIEIKFGGFGGQGVILAGIIIGRAASIYDDKFATLTQSFGPEARGSACSAQVIVSGERILYPYVTRPEILLVMSQEACNKFLPEATDDATVIIEEDLVNPRDSNRE